jgi:hypothetical protein
MDKNIPALTVHHHGRGVSSTIARDRLISNSSYTIPKPEGVKLKDKTGGFPEWDTAVQSRFAAAVRTVNRGKISYLLTIQVIERARVIGCIMRP